MNTLRTLTHRGRLHALVLSLSVVAGCGGGQASEETTPGTAAPEGWNIGRGTTVAAAPTRGQGPSGAGASIDESGAAHSLVEAGIGLAGHDDCAGAIERGFNPAIRIYESQRQPGVRYRAVRPPAGGFNASNQPTAAAGEVLVGPDWPDAYFRRAYCQIELRQLADAEASLQAALQLMPDDVVYLCELGFIYQERHQWVPSINIFRRAQQTADRMWERPGYGGTMTQPEGAPVMDLPLVEWRARSRRGIAFSLVELNRLDEAEAVLHECLRIKPGDEASQRELAAIANIRQRRAQPSSGPSTAGSI